MSSFASWNLIGNLEGVTYTQGVNILLNIFFGSSVNAARGISYQVQSTVNKFSSNFQAALNPQIIKSYAANNYYYMHKLIFASSKYSYFLLFFLSLPILIQTEQILDWWLTIVPEYTAHFLRIIIVITLIEALANPLIIAAQATGKIKVYQSVVGGVLLMILPFSFIMLKYSSLDLLFNNRIVSSIYGITYSLSIVIIHSSTARKNNNTPKKS
jgi:O-antigen/teichoic acid export membrane protein